MDLLGLNFSSPLNLLITLLIASSLFLLLYYIFLSIKNRRAFPRFLIVPILILSALGVLAHFQSLNKVLSQNNLAISKQTSANTSAVLGEETSACPDNSSICQISQSDWLKDASNYLTGDLIISINGRVKIVKDAITSDTIAFRAIKNKDLAYNSVTSRIIKDRTIESDDLARDLTIKRLTIDDWLKADNVEIGTIDLGNNTISDGEIFGDWNFGSGNLTTTGIIYGTVAGSFAPSGDVDMANHILINIGNVGTDFTTSGGLTLANALTVASGGASITGNVTLVGTSGILKSTAGVVSGSSTTSDLPEGTNLYYLDSRARSAISNTTTGLAYNSTTGIFTLTSGYVIPTTTEESNWNDAYSKRVDSWNYPLSFSGNIVSFGYNATNLKLTSNALNTIQDIAAASTPTFAGLTLNGNLILGANTFTTTNTTLIANLNADLLDGQHGSYYQTAYTNLTSIGALANATGWLYNNGSGTFSYSTPTGLISGLTSGYIPYATSGTALGNSALFYDGTNLGIGTTNPIAKLEIAGGNIRLADNYNLQWGGVNNYLTGSNASNYLAFATNGTEAMRINSSGYLGIGTTSPNAKLEINGTAVPIGPNLISNGTFDSNADGWTLGGDTGTYSNGHVTVTYSDTSVDDPTISTEINVESGKTYLLTFTLSNVSGDTVYYYFDNISQDYQPDLNNGTYNIAFTSDFDGLETIYFENYSWNDGSSWTIDDVSIKEISSIQPSLKVIGYDGSVALSVGGDLLGNTALGLSSLASNTSGSLNSAMGEYTLYSNTTGGGNSAMGWGSLFSNTTGYFNTAIGAWALSFNTTGNSNSVVGEYSLVFNTTGSRNSSMGRAALQSNTTGNGNSAMGWDSLFSNTTGYHNSAIGGSALHSNTTGDSNSAQGMEALLYNTTGSNNSALGSGAGLYFADGSTRLEDPENSIYIGANSRGFNNSDSNSIVIGYEAIGKGANTTVLGNTSTLNNYLYGKLNINDTQVLYLPNQTNFTGTLIIGNGGGTLSHISGSDGKWNTFVGMNTGVSNTTGYNNNAFGEETFYSNTTGANNNAFGNYSLYENTTGEGNHAFGDSALGSNTTGNENNAFGGGTLFGNITGNYNSAYGFSALFNNTTGSNNIALGYGSGEYFADGSTELTDPENSIYIGYGTRGFNNSDNNSIVIGYQAIGKGANTTVLGNTSTLNNYLYGKLNINDTQVLYLPDQTDFEGTLIIGNGGGALVSGANYNTFVGVDAGYSNTTGNWNSAQGADALSSNTTGYNNSAQGKNALSSNTTGNNNSAQGVDALFGNTTGSNNVAMGYSAGYAGEGAYNNNTLIGYQVGYGTSTPGFSNNTAIGYQAGYNLTGNSNVMLGNFAGAYELGSNSFYVDNQDRTNTAGDKAKALMYGVFDALPANQKLTINGNVGIGKTNPAFSLDVAGKIGINGTQVIYLPDQTNFTGTLIIGNGGGTLSSAGGGGQSNTFIGLSSGFSNTTGGWNTFVGDSAGYLNTTGIANTFMGDFAGYSNTEGMGNVFLGDNAGFYNTTGDYNNFIGSAAGLRNITGNYNNFFGNDVGRENTTGSYNSAFGDSVLFENTTGSYNSAFGESALSSNTAGSNNSAIGYNAGRYQVDGSTNLTSPENSIYIGANSRGFNNSDDNSIVIGYQAIGKGANTTVLGNTSTISTNLYGALNIETAVATPNVTGDNLVTNGTFDTDTNWTKGAGWTIHDGKAYKAAGNTNAIEQTIAGIDPDSFYILTFDITSGSASFNVGFAGGEENDYCNNRDVLCVFKGGSGNLVITPDDAGFTFSMDNIVVKKLLPRTPILSVYDGNNNISLDIRGGATIPIGGAVDYEGAGSIYMGRGAGGYSYDNANTVAENVVIGDYAGASIVFGGYNTFIGSGAGQDTTGGYANTFIGDGTGMNNTTGSFNSALGYYAGMYQSDGSTPLETAENSIYIGAYSRGFNNSDDNSIVIGYQAIGKGANTTVLGNTSTLNNYLYGKLNINDTQVMYLPDQTNFTGTLIIGNGGGALTHGSGTQGFYNTFVGIGAGYSNTTGNRNSAQGGEALYSNTTGGSNLAQGAWALYSNTTGNNNSAQGESALYSNTTGSYNLAQGNSALYSNTTGSGNVAMGFGAGNAGEGAYNNNTLIGNQVGYNTSTPGYSNNTAIGYQAGYNLTGNNNVMLGNFAGAYELGSNSFYIDNQDRTNTAGDKAKALMYGVFDALPANQKLTINANVGIGTTSPQKKLEINDADSNTTTSGLRFTNFACTGDDKLTVGAGGDLICATDQVGGGAGNVIDTLAATLGAANDANALDINNIGKLYAALGTVGVPAYSFQTDTDTGIWSSAANTLNFSTNATERMRISSTGNVGIGTTNPAFPLDVAGKIGINGTQVLYLPDQTNFTGSLIIGNGGGALTHGSGTEGFYNTFVGLDAGYSNTTGYSNHAFGLGALYSNTTGNDNNVFGDSALSYNTTGSENSAFGSYALMGNTTGSNNVAMGYGAGFSVDGEYNNNTLIGYQVGDGAFTTAYSNNTAIGYQAGYNLTGNGNVMLGNFAGAYELGSNSFYVDNQDRTNTAGDKAKALMYGIFDALPANQKLTINASVGIGKTNPSFPLDVAGKIGINGTQVIYLPDQTNFGGTLIIGNGGGSLLSGAIYNTFVGIDAGYSNTTGYANSAQGSGALYSNTTGYSNSAQGADALSSNTTGYQNSAMGDSALSSNTTGNSNSAQGAFALYYNTTGSKNVAMGYNAGYSGEGEYNNNTLIGTEIGYNTLETFDNNTVVGYHAGYNLTGDSNVMLGNFAGAYELGSNSFYLDNQDRTNTAGDKAKALMYGVFDALPANQKLTINASVGIGKTNPAFSLDVAGKIGINGTQVLYLPDQTNFTGSLIIGNGGGALSHTTGNTGRYNTFVGIGSGFSNTTGYKNNAVGNSTLFNNTTGPWNNAFGDSVLYNNTTGESNNAFGDVALYANTTGSNNSAFGDSALSGNITGSENSAFGIAALVNNTTGNWNSAFGESALEQNTTGSYNSAIGYNAGTYQANGSTPLSDPENSIYIGANSRGFNNSDDNSIVIGYEAIGKGANTTVLGNTSTLNNYLYGKLNLNDTQVLYLPDQTDFEGTLIIGNGGGALTHGSGSEGFYNTFLGIGAGYSNTTGFYNSTQGAYALYSNTTGNYNSAIGQEALFSNTTGSYNSAMGRDALFSNTTGSDNTVMGYGAGYAGEGAYNNNTLIGYQVGYNTSTPGYSNNTAIGYQAGYNLTGNNNVMLGNFAGAYELGSNSFYVDNQDRTNTAGDKAKALMYGVFDALPANQKLTINGNLGIGTTNPTYALTVAGTAWVTSGAWSGSDARWKTNVKTLVNPLDKVMQLSGVTYNWDQADYPQNNFDNLTHLGFIAQDVEKIVPQLVTTGPDGYKGIDYNGLAPLLVGAVQEQQTEISNFKLQISNQFQSSNDQIAKLLDNNISSEDKIKIIGSSLSSQNEILKQIQDDNLNFNQQLSEQTQNVASLQTQLDSQAKLITDLEDQMKLIQDQTKSIIDFELAFNLDKAIFKDAENNVDLLNGKLEAGGVVAGAFTVKVVDPDAKTIGQSEITPIEKDEDDDGIDDETGSDGQSVKVNTKAAKDTSRIFITPIGKKPVSWIISEVEKDKGFTIQLSEPTEKDIKFNWWIVEEK